MADVRDRFTHQRYVWLDQARGLVGILYVVSLLTWHLQADPLTSVPLVAPPHLDHGYNYFPGQPPMLTLIDIGQSIFIFYVGISAWIAFNGRRRRNGLYAAWRYVAVRIALLYAISIIGEMRKQLPGTNLADWPRYFAQFDWYGVLLTGILATIATSALVTYLVTTIVRLPHHRALLAIFGWATSALMHEAYFFDRDTGLDFMLQLPNFPLMTLNMAFLAVFGSCYGQWIHDSGDDLNDTMRQHIVPTSLRCIAVAYCLEWVQPADHHDATAALALLAAGLSGLLMASQYALLVIGVTAPILRAMGRNLLFVFLIGAIGCPLYLSQLPQWLIYDYPVVRMILVGIIPLAAIVGMALGLDRRNIFVRI